MSAIDREKLITGIQRKIRLYQQFEKGWRKQGVESRAREMKEVYMAFGELLDEIQSGAFDLRETEPTTLKPGDRVRHVKHERLGVGVVMAVSQKRSLVKFPKAAAVYFPNDKLVKVEDDGHDA